MWEKIKRYWVSLFVPSGSGCERSPVAEVLLDDRVYCSGCKWIGERKVSIVSAVNYWDGARDRYRVDSSDVTVPACNHPENVEHIPTTDWYEYREVAAVAWRPQDKNANNDCPLYEAKEADA